MFYFHMSEVFPCCRDWKPPRVCLLPSGLFPTGIIPCRDRWVQHSGKRGHIYTAMMNLCLNNHYRSPYYCSPLNIQSVQHLPFRDSDNIRHPRELLRLPCIRETIWRRTLAGDDYLFPGIRLLGRQKTCT